MGHHDEQLMAPLNLTGREIQDLLAFLGSLTDVEIPSELRSPPESPVPSQAPGKPTLRGSRRTKG